MKFNTGVQITGQIYWQMKTGNGYLELPQDKNSIQQVLSYVDQGGALRYATGEYPFGIQRVVDDYTPIGEVSFTTSITLSKPQDTVFSTYENIPTGLSGTYTRSGPHATKFTGISKRYEINYHPSTGYYILDKVYGAPLYTNVYINPNINPLFGYEEYWSYDPSGPLEIEVKDLVDYWEDNYIDPVNTPKINSQITGKYRRANYTVNSLTGVSGNKIDKINRPWGGYDWGFYNGTTQRYEYYTNDNILGVGSYVYANWDYENIYAIQITASSGEIAAPYINVSYQQSLFREKDYRTTGIFSLGSDAFIFKKGGKGQTANGEQIDLIKTIVFDKENNFYLDAKNLVIHQENVVSKEGGSLYNSIVGGINNNIASSSQNATILGGVNNSIQNASSSIVAGSSNSVGDSSSSSIIAGNSNSIVSSSNSFIAGGYLNNILYSASNSFIAGGDRNSIIGNNSFLGAGGSNAIRSLGGHPYNVLVGGALNSIYAGTSFLGGGLGNAIGSSVTPTYLPERYMSYSFLGGGRGNFLLGQANVLVGGYENRNVGNRSFVGAGYHNHIDIDLEEGDLYWNQSKYTTLLGSGLIPVDGAVVGGAWNRLEAKSSYSFIGAGFSNKISYSQFSFIPGGSGNWIAGSPNSFVIGSRGTIKNLDGGKILQFNTVNGWQEYNVPSIPNKGVGIINDGYWPIYNSFYPKSLHLGFTHGLVFQPFVNLQSSAETTKLSIEDFKESVNEINAGFLGHESGAYIGYTGWTETRQDYLESRCRFINIGTHNITKHNFIDLSGFFYPDADKEKTLLRAYNPSVVIGALNSGGHQNILLGVSNVAFFTPVEDIETGYYAGRLDTNLISGIKSLNGAPWPFQRTSWPYYQGKTTLIGHANQSTGSNVSVLGSFNLILENQGPTAIVGISNNLLPQKSIVLTNSSGYATGIIYPSLNYGDIISYKQNTAVLGFNNQEQLGINSNIIGSDNTAISSFSNILGYRNMVSGGKLNVAGGSNFVYGGFNNTQGYFNILGGGLYNTIIGSSNLIVGQGFASGISTFNSNVLIGDRNTAAGSYSVLLGTDNRFGIGSGYNFGETTLVGVNNIAEKGSNILLGNYNNTSGSFTAILGFNNLISGNNYNSVVGINNIVNGQNAHSFGSNNKVNAHGAIAVGREAYAYNKNQIAIAGGSLGTSWPGSAQKTILFWKGITSGNQIMELTLDGVNHNNNYISGKATIPSGTFWHGTLNIVAVETGLNSYRSELKSVIALNKGATIVVPEQKSITSKFIGVGASGWQVAAAGDNTNKALNLTASGEANKIIFWNVIGEFNEMFVPTKETVAIDKYINNEIVSTVIANGVEWYSSNQEGITPPLETSYPPSRFGPAPGDYY